MKKITRQLKKGTGAKNELLALSFVNLVVSRELSEQFVFKPGCTFLHCFETSRQLEQLAS